MGIWLQLECLKHRSILFHNKEQTSNMMEYVTSKFEMRKISMYTASQHDLAIFKGKLILQGVPAWASSEGGRLSLS